MSAFHDRAQALFLQARELPASERDAFLSRIGAEDEALRREVESLLEAEQDAGSFLRDATPTIPAQPAQSSEFAPGMRIGPYKLIAQLGVGGFGEVWKASQQTPIRREVAIKFVDPKHSSPLILSRFESERQLLARMNSTGIAAILDAGATPAGTPFFVMELVKGEWITKHCRRHSVGLRDRIRLMIHACDAIRHAHQKGVVHRDIKPSNVLVTEISGAPVVKVIDFGIAKAMDISLADPTLTRAGDLLGTPLYMSPEQAMGDDVDTRTDVYGLGTLLYELLTGSPPFDAYTADGRMIPNMRIIELIREIDPPAPSARLAAARADSTSLSASALRGELDCINLKALAKAPAERYQTVEQLTSDLTRYLNNEPIHAIPPSLFYHARKFARRNSAAVGIGALALLSLVLGVIGTTIGLLNAKQQRARAERNEQAAIRLAESESLARQNAEAALERAMRAESNEAEREAELKTVILAQINQIANLDPAEFGVILRSQLLSHAEAAPALAETVDKSASQAETLDRILTQLNLTDVGRGLLIASFVTSTEQVIQEVEPLRIRGRLLNELAHSVLRSGEHDHARRLNQKALQILQDNVEPAAMELLKCRHMDAALLDNEGQYQEAEAAYRALLADCEASGDSVALDISADVWHDLSDLLRTTGRLAEAENCIRKSVELADRIVDPDGKRAFSYRRSLGTIVFTAGRRTEGEQILRDLLADITAKGKENSREALTVCANLAGAALQRNDLQEAESLTRRAVTGYQRLLGNEHATTLIAKNNLAIVLQLRGKHKASVTLQREVYEQTVRRFGENHAETIATLTNLGGCLLSTEEFQEAEAALMKALDAYIQLNLPPDRLIVKHLLARLYYDARFPDAERRIRLILAEETPIAGATHLWTLQVHLLLGRELIEQQRYPEAEELLLDARDCIQNPEYAVPLVVALDQALEDLYLHWPSPGGLSFLQSEDK